MGALQVHGKRSQLNRNEMIKKMLTQEAQLEIREPKHLLKYMTLLWLLCGAYELYIHLKLCKRRISADLTLT